jgi:hypothetical protein
VIEPAQRPAPFPKLTTPVQVPSARPSVPGTISPSQGRLGVRPVSPSSRLPSIAPVSPVAPVRPVDREKILERYRPSTVVPKAPASTPAKPSPGPSSRPGAKPASPRDPKAPKDAARPAPAPTRPSETVRPPKGPSEARKPGPTPDEISKRREDYRNREQERITERRDAFRAREQEAITKRRADWNEMQADSIAKRKALIAEQATRDLRKTALVDPKKADLVHKRGGAIASAAGRSLQYGVGVGISSCWPGGWYWSACWPGWSWWYGSGWYGQYWSGSYWWACGSYPWSWTYHPCSWSYWWWYRCWPTRLYTWYPYGYSRYYYSAPVYYSTVVERYDYDDDDDDGERVVYVEQAPAQVGESVEYREPAPAAEPAPAEPQSAVKSVLEGGPDSLARASGRYLELGDQAFRERRYGDAAHFYAKAIEFRPGEGVLFLVLSDALLATGDYHYGAYALRRALELDPALAAGELDKHAFYADPSEFDHQVELLERFLADHPADDDARILLAANYLFGARAGAALDLLDAEASARVRATPAGTLIHAAAKAALAKAK